MNILGKGSGIYTDFYQLTMAQGYFLTGRSQSTSCFDYFFRENPFKSGYVIFAGLADALEMIENYYFDEETVEYLRGLKFREEFLQYLRTFKFRGTITSAREGEIVFPLEPFLRVEGTLIEAQVVETMLLNILNFESLIATKASRVKSAAGSRRVVDFGLRRAQGFGGIQATKAAIIGGIDATSNVYAAYMNDFEVSGTQAHSWVQSFSDELSAFRKYAEIYPDDCVLLVDTYNTLRSGLPNAITVGMELEQRGHRLRAIRLDSGDLAYLSKHARQMLDQAGLTYVNIAVSNQLDEYVIRSLLEDQEAPIDFFGVGTRLITGQPAAALEGVYKLSMCDGKPRLKFSENYTKLTLPGVKSIHRFLNSDGMFCGDAVTLEGEPAPDNIIHPFFPEQRSSLKHFASKLLMHQVMVRGVATIKSTPQESAAYVQEGLTHLAGEHKRFEFPHIYKVGISQELLNLRTRLVEEFQKRIV